MAVAVCLDAANLLGTLTRHSERNCDSSETRFRTPIAVFIAATEQR